MELLAGQGCDLQLQIGNLVLNWGLMRRPKCDWSRAWRLVRVE